MAEIEIGIMNRQALGKPLPDLESSKQQIRAWTIKWNVECAKLTSSLRRRMHELSWPDYILLEFRN